MQLACRSQLLELFHFCFAMLLPSSVLTLRASRTPFPGGAHSPFAVVAGGVQDKYMTLSLRIKTETAQDPGLQEKV